MIKLIITCLINLISFYLERDMVILRINWPWLIDICIKFINVWILNQVYSNTIIIKPTKKKSKAYVTTLIFYVSRKLIYKVMVTNSKPCSSKFERRWSFDGNKAQNIFIKLHRLPHWSTHKRDMIQWEQWKSLGFTNFFNLHFQLLFSWWVLHLQSSAYYSFSLCSESLINKDGSYIKIEIWLPSRKFPWRWFTLKNDNSIVLARLWKVQVD